MLVAVLVANLLDSLVLVFQTLTAVGRQAAVRPQQVPEVVLHAVHGGRDVFSGADSDVAPDESLGDSVQLACQ